MDLNTDARPTNSSQLLSHIMQPAYSQPNDLNQNIDGNKLDSHKQDKELGQIYSQSQKAITISPKTQDRKQLNLTPSQTAELMRRFNDLERAHFDLKQRHSR